jgi:hypothetical protein
MKFRTEVNIQNSEKKIFLTDSIFSVGSCFAAEMSEMLRNGQMQTLCNPFGTIFNPFSLNVAIKNLHDCKIYKEADLILYNEEYISLNHHTSFNNNYAHKTLEKINQNIEIGNQFLQKTNWVIITYGTSFIYEFLPKNQLVANCHKIPQKFFNKRLLTDEELKNSIQKTIETLQDICEENVQILFSVSPVRHTKDGMSENLLSKSKLINALHETLPHFENCHYLPIYEIMTDDLRDYRFYKEDLIHPNNQAIQYIWEKFGNAYFSDEVKTFINENYKIKAALEHRPIDEKSPKYLDFLEKLKEKIVLQQQKVKHKIFTE